jgi:hypothetical protein
MVSRYTCKCNYSYAPQKNIFFPRWFPQNTQHHFVQISYTEFLAIEKRKCKTGTETRLSPQRKFGFYCTNFHEMSITEQTSPITKHPNWTKNVDRKRQGIVQPKTSDERPDGEKRYNSTLPLTSALDAGAWSTSSFSRFIPGKETRYPLYRGADKSLARPGRKQATATEDFEFHISFL